MNEQHASVEHQVSAEEPAEGLVAALTDVEHAILKLEGELFTYSGTKENRIREQFGWSAVRYFQVLNALIDTQAAEAAYPVTVHRLQRLRATRRGAR